jgi:hypothetical protein
MNRIVVTTGPIIGAYGLVATELRRRSLQLNYNAMLDQMEAEMAQQQLRHDEEVQRLHRELCDRERYRAVRRSEDAA